jgi:hypothetical protein
MSFSCVQPYRKFFVLDDKELKGANAYLQQGSPGKFPRIASVRVRVTSSTVKGESPKSVEGGYKRWTAWEDEMRQVCPRLICRMHGPRGFLLHIAGDLM